LVNWIQGVVAWPVACGGRLATVLQARPSSGVTHRVVVMMMIICCFGKAALFWI
jgi:hypothetical protein